MDEQGRFTLKNRRPIASTPPLGHESTNAAEHWNRSNLLVRGRRVGTQGPIFGSAATGDDQSRRRDADLARLVQRDASLGDG